MKQMGVEQFKPRGHCQMGGDWFELPAHSDSSERLTTFCLLECLN